MSNEATTARPFGAYIQNKFPDRRVGTVRKLLDLYEGLCGARTTKTAVSSILRLSGHLDETLEFWRERLGSTVTPFSTFRGNFVEEVALQIADHTLRAEGKSAELEAVKLPTGKGILTGCSLAFAKTHVPDPVPVVFLRDREDLVVGYRRRLSVTAGSDVVYLDDEIVPICVIACKVYVDATRLENVLSKVRNLYSLYSNCDFVVLAEWDALGADWHHGDRVLDSLIAPIREIIFLRGSACRRPRNAELGRASRENPYLRTELNRLASTIADAIS